MSLFPMFVNLEGKNVLVVGGGNVAARKIEKLLPFKPKITVVAKKIKRDEIKKLAEKHNITLIERQFLFTDIDRKDMVIVAVDDVDLQREVYNYCVRRRIPVNCVDSPDYCTFIFPALVIKDELVIGISTSGTVPGLSAKIREKIENCLPENIEDVLKKLKQIRESMPKGEERQKKILEIINKLL